MEKEDGETIGSQSSFEKEEGFEGRRSRGDEKEEESEINTNLESSIELLCTGRNAERGEVQRQFRRSRRRERGQGRKRDASTHPSTSHHLLSFPHLLTLPMIPRLPSPPRQSRSGFVSIARTSLVFALPPHNRPQLHQFPLHALSALRVESILRRVGDRVSKVVEVVEESESGGRLEIRGEGGWRGGKVDESFHGVEGVADPSSWVRFVVPVGLRGEKIIGRSWRRKGDER